MEKQINHVFVNATALPSDRAGKKPYANGLCIECAGSGVALHFQPKPAFVVWESVPTT